MTCYVGKPNSTTVGLAYRRLLTKEIVVGACGDKSATSQSVTCELQSVIGQVLRLRMVNGGGIQVLMLLFTSKELALKTCFVQRAEEIEVNIKMLV